MWLGYWFTVNSVDTCYLLVDLAFVVFWFMLFVVCYFVCLCYGV